MNIPKLNIAIIDDHKLVASLLEEQLSRQSFVKNVTSFENARIFLNQSKTGSFDLLIIDLLMPDMHGHEVIKALKKSHEIQAPKVIVLSSIVTPSVIKESLSIGANGYLSKNTGIKEIQKAIYDIFINEEVYIDPLLVQQFIKSEVISSPIDNLTSREKEVLQLLCKGEAPKNIAKILSLSLPTIQTYIQRLLNKFEVNRTSELIIKALQKNIVTP